MAMAQTKPPTGSQLQCRTKAKEVAKIAYDDCIELAKGNEAERIRNEYKAKMAKLKDYYEQKLKKLNVKTKTATVVPAVSESMNLPPKTDIVAPVKTETIAPTVSSSRLTPTESEVPSESTPTTESPTEPVIRLKPANQAPDNQESLDNPPELSI